MPATVTKVDGYKVSTPGGRKAKSTTYQKAKAQQALLNAIEHGNWRPTGKKKARRYKKRPLLAGKA